MTNKNKTSRIKEFQKILKQNKIDAYIVNDILNQGFLTGYFKSYADEYILLITQKSAKAFIKQMLVSQMKKICPECKTVGLENHKIISSFAEELSKYKNIAFDPEKETYILGKLWQKNKAQEIGGLLTKMREIKNDAELKNLKKACKIAVKAYDIIKKKIKPGRTEKSVALELEYIMKTLGAEDTSFNTIVAAGPNSAFPHHETSDRKIKNNEVVLLDFGCKYNHYCSDITRTFFLGKKPPALFKKVQDIVVRAHNEGIKKVKEGVKAKQIDAACRDYITKHGYGKHFTHSTGHGIGLEAHDAFVVSRINEMILKKDMTFTVEPGIYLNGKFGVRHENIVVVKKNNCEIITK